MIEVKQRIQETMEQAVAATQSGYDGRTGRFIRQPDGPPAPGARPEDLGWAVMNQDIIYPLALLYTTPGCRFHGDPAIRMMILRGGDAIRDFQQPDGRVEFVKIDGSRWGFTYMGWTNYAWLEAYALIRDELDTARRQRWEAGLTLAHDGQAREISELHIHNILCWKAMSCYRAGQLFDRRDWREAGTAMIRAVAAAQNSEGYWPEHGGPTPLYNFVYTHGVGLYYAFTRDPTVLPVLEAAAHFHQTFTYPGGAPVETVDGRVKYSGHIMPMGWVGFSASPLGRRLVRHLADRLDARRDLQSFQGGAIASSLQYLIDGDEAPIDLDQPAYRKAYGNWAMLCRDTPWFACLSTYTAPPVASRWGLDRQSFLSLAHDRFGLILGGGNSKDQAEWSSFVADGRLLPDRGELLPDGSGITLHYGQIRCLLRLRFENGEVIIEGEAQGGPALQQFVLQARPGNTIRSATGLEAHLGDGAVCWGPRETGGRIVVNDCRIDLPPGAEFRWPTVAFNAYAADGASAFDAARGILSARIDDRPIRWTLTGDAPSGAHRVAATPRPTTHGEGTGDDN